MIVPLGGGGGVTRRAGLRRIKERLKNVSGASGVRYEPSVIRPRTVIADIDVGMFLGRAFPRGEGRIEIRWRPREGTDMRRVQWIDAEVSLGWHKDDDHSDLGTTHFQVDSGDEIGYGEGRIEVEAPLSFLETCFERLPDRLADTART